MLNIFMCIILVPCIPVLGHTLLANFYDAYADARYGSTYFSAIIGQLFFVAVRIFLHLEEVSHVAWYINVITAPVLVSSVMKLSIVIPPQLAVAQNNSGLSPFELLLAGLIGQGTVYVVIRRLSTQQFWEGLRRR